MSEKDFWLKQWYEFAKIAQKYYCGNKMAHLLDCSTGIIDNFGIGETILSTTRENFNKGKYINLTFAWKIWVLKTQEKKEAGK